jgi:hypothetical protein
VKTGNLFACAAVSVFCFALTAPSAIAQVGSDRESLRGLGGIGVTLRIDDEAIESGLTPDQIGTDVTLRLRKAGIHVLDGADAEVPKGRARIVVVVNATKIQGSIYTYSVSAVVMQDVTLARANSAHSFYATTWDSTRLKGITSGDLRQIIRNALGDVVDKFINDYLAVNPKP